MWHVDWNLRIDTNVIETNDIDMNVIDTAADVAFDGWLHPRLNLPMAIRELFSRLWVSVSNAQHAGRDQMAAARQYTPRSNQADGKFEPYQEDSKFEPYQADCKFEPYQRG